MGVGQSFRMERVSNSIVSTTEAPRVMAVAGVSGGRVTMVREIVYPGGDEAWPGGQPPASKASIEALPTVETKDLMEACAVCLEWLGDLTAKEMPCGHKYHAGCIKKWLGLHGSCPVCRFKMPAEEGETSSATPWISLTTAVDVEDVEGEERRSARSRTSVMSTVYGVRVERRYARRRMSTVYGGREHGRAREPRIRYG